MSTSDLLSNTTESLPKILTTPTSNEENISNNLSDAPDWLTKDYLEESLQSHFNDNKLKITKIVCHNALGKGENYGGVLTRIKTDYRTSAGIIKTGHYIVKTSFEGNEFAQKTMEPYDIFNREMTIYEHVLPKLNSLLHEIDDNEQIFAETLAVDYKRSALIFEDLSVREFKMPDRLKGLNMKLAKIVLRKLAKMHATSAVLNERESGILECHDRGMFNRHTNNYAPCFLGMLMACSRQVNQWNDFKRYSEKLAALKPVYMEYGKRVFDPIPGHLNVLAHGDLWTNNVMVKYDKNGEPLDVIILDFQYSAWGSPAIDLHYFFNSSLEEDLHINHLDELTQYYYYHLADTLRKLHYKANIPSLHQFHLQMEEKAFYALNTTLVVQPIQRNEETEDADYNALMMEDERAVNFKNTCYKNQNCQRIIRQLLPLYDRKGLLDIDQ